MKKSELKTGMIVKLRGGIVGVVLKDTTSSSKEIIQYVNNKDSFGGIDYLGSWSAEFKSNLNYGGKGMDIVAIYSVALRGLPTIYSGDTDAIEKVLKDLHTKKLFTETPKTIHLRGVEYSKEDFQRLHDEVTYLGEEFLEGGE